MTGASEAVEAPAEDPRLIDGHRETLIYTDLFFGGFLMYIVLVGLIAWFRGEVSGVGVLSLVFFVASNVVFTQVSIRMKNPLLVELLRPILGGIICPMAYLLVDGPLAPFWPGYVIMCLGGGIALGIVTERPFWGRILVIYYLINFTVATYFGFENTDWYQFAVHAGVIAMCGLMFAQVMSVLGRSLRKEHVRSRELTEAHERLRQLDRLKSEFFANISHEFRTPITLTLGPIEAMLSKFHDLPEEALEQLEVMRRNQARLLDLVNQILDLSKLEERKMDLRASRVLGLNAFVKERVERFRPLAAKRGLALETELDPAVDDALLYLDLEKIDKVLFNLLSNAHKFTKQGSIRARTAIDGDLLLLEISDTGAGIPEGELEHIFDRFRQVDSGASREHAGTGIGLALVREICVLHGGEVRVDSVHGEGSTFEVRVPLGVDHLDPASIVEAYEASSVPETGPHVFEIREGVTDASTVAEVNAEAERLADPDKPTVLCVDDNGDLRDYIRALLLDDHNVLVAVDGEHGLALARDRRPDLILSDLMMPRMTGAELCRAVRDDAYLQGTPFVMLTAKADLGSKIEGLEEGADDYLSKPFSPSELLARVKNLILLSRKERQLRAAFRELREKNEDLRDDLEQAEAFQRSILPRVPATDWVQFHMRYQPAHLVGGDIYDVHQLAPDHFRLFLGDAVGHGVQASLRTMLVKNEYDRVKGTAQTPKDVLVALNRELARTPAGLLPACCVDVLRNGGSGARIIYANAGHPPLFLVQRGAGKPLYRPGPFLGLLPEVELECEELTIERNDRLFAFTDGLYEEWSPGGEEYGHERVEAELLRPESVVEVVEAVITDLRAFLAGGDQADDLTIIGLECRL